MAMDWLSGFTGAYAPQPQEDVEDDEDFYGFGDADGEADTTAGAQTEESDTSAARETAAVSGFAPATISDEERKKQQEESQKHLDALRAKLLAKRASSSRPETPARMTTSTGKPVVAPVVAPVQLQQQERKQQQNDTPPADEYGLESLLAEGQAAAEAETARKNEQAATALAAPEQRMDTTSARKTTEKEDVKAITTPARPAPASSGTVQQQISTDSHAPKSNTNNRSNLPPLKLSDPYYDDLPVWLEFTGYHDQAFRDSKLGTYKQRKRLEQEAARIAQELEKLKAAETNDLASLRASSAHPSAVPAMAPPPLPSVMPSGELRPTTNGVKRPHSPEYPASEKAIRRNGDTGFRIRGADETSAAVSRRNGSPVERRQSFAERRRSLDDRERDPSLERRQRNYRRDGAGPLPPDTYSPAREPPRPFNRGERDRERDPTSDFSNVNVAGGYRDGGRQYRGSSGLDLRKGGVRYFMIKSWNHDNVLQAMKDDVWATQEKNEKLLTEAFRTSRHVILLFSVNKSMAFQGYALMTSPPLPSIRKPSFCEKLNWGTSSAFSLRWLATTPVHFRMVGHLKNTCNPDEEGQPRAVLVGKDGQEISQEAGMGVVWILDEVEEVEAKRLMAEGKM